MYYMPRAPLFQRIKVIWRMISADRFDQVSVAHAGSAVQAPRSSMLPTASSSDNDPNQSQGQQRIQGKTNGHKMVIRQLLGPQVGFWFCTTTVVCCGLQAHIE